MLQSRNQVEEMSLRNLTKVPKLTLVYFSVDKSTCVVETKRLRLKDDKKPFLVSKPERKDAVTVKSEGKVLEAMVIATHGEYTCILPMLRSS